MCCQIYSGRQSENEFCQNDGLVLAQMRPLMRERQGGGWVLAAAAAALEATALPAACFHLPEAALRR